MTTSLSAIMESVVPGKARSQSENDRLNVQHELAKSIMGGKLLLAPVDLRAANLRILDSGTAQANWLLDMADLVGPGAQLIGTDIATNQFPDDAQRPASVQLQSQSIFEAWPAKMQANFDVVHQRFVLAAAKSDEQACQAIASLVALAKPGGWIELHEGNMLSIQEGPRHPAMMQFRDLAAGVWEGSLGQIPDPGARLGAWLRSTEAIDIYEETQTVRLGAAADTEEDGERGILLCMIMFGAIRRILQGMFAASENDMGCNPPLLTGSSGTPGCPSAEELDELKTGLEKELRVVGNIWNYHLVYGRRPETSGAGKVAA